MNFNTADLIGSIGVTILLIAFLLNVLNKISRSGIVYIFLNIIGAGLACLASWMIDYLPFVILEATWALVSIFAIIKYFKNLSQS